jgi:hypothetical protein
MPNFKADSELGLIIYLWFTQGLSAGPDMQLRVTYKLERLWKETVAASHIYIMKRDSFIESDDGNSSNNREVCKGAKKNERLTN